MSKNWDKVGEYLKANAGQGVALVGSLLTGNVPGAVAAGVALVSSATGSNNADEVLAQLQGNPETMVELKRLAVQEQENIRVHLRTMAEIELKDQQHQHQQQQETIRSGDNAEDKFVRRTRPGQAWFFAGVSVAWAFWTGCDTELELYVLMTFMSYPLAYAGFRMVDKAGNLAGVKSALVGKAGVK